MPRPPGKRPKVLAPPSLYGRGRGILESARAGVARSVNTAQVVANWLIGREIVEEELRGNRRATYGRRQVERLARRLTAECGCGYSLRNLWFMKQFYLACPDTGHSPTVNALRSQSGVPGAVAVSDFGAGSWKPGWIHPNLGWAHSRAFMKAEHAPLRVLLAGVVDPGVATVADEPADAAGRLVGAGGNR